MIRHVHRAYITINGKPLGDLLPPTTIQVRNYEQVNLARLLPGQRISINFKPSDGAYSRWLRSFKKLRQTYRKAFRPDRRQRRKIRRLEKAKARRFWESKTVAFDQAAYQRARDRICFDGVL